MQVLDYIYNVFLMLGGLAVFMFGMKIMGDNLERVAGGKMRTLLGKVSNNRFAGVGIGAGVTMLIQSSSATTVMLVGFVNVGMVSLFQATAIIMGANIGTTITAQIASLSVYKSVINITAIFSMLALVGVFMNMFSSKDRVRRVGIIMAGLGMLFIGLELMSSSMEAFKELPAFVEAIKSVTNPFLLLFIGIVFTAIIQSSSAATGILIPLVSTGLMSIGPALYFVLGTNIGTCVTAMLASIGSSTNGKRTALIHLLFNVVGAVVFMAILVPLEGPIISLLGAISGEEASRQLANFHTVFNVLVTLILLPFIKIIVQISEKVIKERPITEKSKEEEGESFEYIDERLLETPPVAVSQTIKEVIRMNTVARDNLARAFGCLLEYDEEALKKVEKEEKTVDYLNKNLTAFLVKITSLDISAHDEKLIGSLYHVISDIERIGDYATNISEYAIKLKNSDGKFSEDAEKDIKTMYDKVMLLYRDVMYTFEKREDKMLSEIARREQEIDEMKLIMSENHIKRLNEGLCSAETGALYLSLASNLERVADHLTNIGYSIKSYTGSMHDTVSNVE